MRLLTADGPPVLLDGAAVLGRYGERQVIATLAAALDDRYIAIDRLRLPGTQADLDLVVIAERITVLEVKTYSGPRRYRVEGSLWTYCDASNSWWPLGASPGTQATFGALRVHGRLAGVRLPVAVQGMVVWAGEAPLEVKAPRVPVLRLSSLADRLASISPISAGRAERIARVLLAGSSSAT